MKYAKGELLPKEELYDLYITQNLSDTACAEHFGVSRGKVRNSLRGYGIVKSKEMRYQAQINTNLRRYGATHPRHNPEKNAEMISKAKQTCLEKYGVEFVGQVPEIKAKAKQTCLDRYGTTGIMALSEFKEKSKQTCLEKYGAEYYTQTDEYKERAKQTCLEKYGVEYTFQAEEVKDKIKQTTLERYGVENTSQSEEIKDKIKQSNLEKYGVEWSIQSQEVREKGRKTWQDKYGVDLYVHTDEMKEKSKQTNRERYGTDYASQSQEFRERVASTCMTKYGNKCSLASEDGIKKKTATWLKNLGVDHPSKCPSVSEKQWESKKRNGHAASSKVEEQIHDLLVERYGTVFRNHKTSLYPFHCDFYIPIIDTYIEYQGFEGHGGHSFDYNNPDDVDKLLLWAERADKKKLDRRNKYLAYVHTWAERDPMKRACASRNKLNWFEFFTFEDFLAWYN